MTRRSSYTLSMAEPARKPPASGGLDDDPFFYGSRWLSVHLPNGEAVLRQIPLTPDDLLDPQLGDEVTQGDQHFDMMMYLVDLLRRHFAAQKDIYIIGDLKMLWRIPGLPGPAPDVAVIPNVRGRENRDSFDVQREGTRPCLVIEVVSSRDATTRRNDYEKKVPIYERAGIPEYLIVDPPTRFTQDRLLLTGYRLGAEGRYRRIEPEDRGALRSETTGLLFGVEADGRTLVVTDVETGERLLTAAEITAELAWEAAARKAAEEDVKREAEGRKTAEAELARVRAELELLRNA
jgi:colicin import membrane protein